MLQALYRFYDVNDRLLYVGISSNWIARLRSHEKQSHFFVLAHTIRIEHFASREAVEQAEITAIQTEKPIFNRRDNPPSDNWQTHLRDLIDMAQNKLNPDSVHRKLFETIGGRRVVMDADEFLMSFRSLWWHATNYNVYSPAMRCHLCDSLMHNDSVKMWEKQLEAAAE